MLTQIGLAQPFLPMFLDHLYVVLKYFEIPNVKTRIYSGLESRSALADSVFKNSLFKNSLLI